MNPHVHPQSMKIVQLRESPASGPLRGTAGQECFNISITKPPRGAPSVAVAFIVLGSIGALTPIFVIYPIHALPMQNNDEP